MQKKISPSNIAKKTTSKTIQNILLINPAQYYGGQAKHVVDIIKNIDSKKFSLFLITPPKSEIITYLKQANVTIIEVGIFAPHILFKVIKQQHIDIIHIHNSGVKYGFFMRSYLFFQKCPVIMTEHLWTKDWRTPRHYLAWLHWLSMFLLNLGITKFIAVSYKVKEFLQEVLLLPPSKITVIYNGVKIPKKSNKKRTLKYPLLISVGNLNLMKNHQLLIKAFANYLKRSNDQKTILQIYGSGPLEKKLIRQIENLHLSKRIYLKGWSDKLDIVYRPAKGVIIPSTNETFCYVAVEAMMYRVPIIATNIGSLPEILGKGLYGTLVPSNDILVMSNAIKKLLTTKNLTALSTNEIRQHAINSFSLKQMIISLEDTYHNILFTKKSPS